MYKDPNKDPSDKDQSKDYSKTRITIPPRCQKPRGQTKYRIYNQNKLFEVHTNPYLNIFFISFNTCRNGHLELESHLQLFSQS